MIRWFAFGVKRIFKFVFSLPIRFCIWAFNFPRRFWRWGLGLPRRASIPIGLLLVVGISFGIYHLVGFWNYMQNNPQFCNSCHIMAESWDRWATSAHNEVGCHSCHHQSLLANISQLYNFVFNSTDEIQNHAEVKEDSCMACHESGNTDWIQVVNTTGHRLHNEIEDIECVVCHSTSVHRFTPTSDACLNCHTDQRVTMIGMDDMHCHLCHDFITETEPFNPERAACLNCHESLATDVMSSAYALIQVTSSADAPMQITWSADAPMQFPCGDCHLPHEQTHVIVDCMDCHTVEGYHLVGSHSMMTCETCHEAHIWNIEERETCLTCHPAQVEHHEPLLCNTCHSYSAHEISDSLE